MITVYDTVFVICECILLVLYNKSHESIVKLERKVRGWMDEKQAFERRLPTCLKVIITVLSILLILTTSALIIRIVYLKCFVDNGSTVIVPDNLISEEEEFNSVGDGVNGTESNDSNSFDSATGDTNDNASNVIGNGTSNGSPDGSEDVTDNTSNTTVNGTDKINSDKKKTTTISLYKGNPNDNEKFSVKNMLPGDTEVKYFCVKMSHENDITLYFETEVTSQTKNLGEILHIKVTHLENGNVLFDGTFNEMKSQRFLEKMPQNSKKETIAYYKIEVSLPTFAGNEYQAAMLYADFRWYVEDVEHLLPPQTSDLNNLELWMFVAVISLVCVCILVSKQRKKEGNKHV